MQHGFEQVAAVGFGGGKLGFQLVAQRHQFIDLGDDAVLFGEWREGNQDCIQDFEINVLLGCSLGC